MIIHASSTVHIAFTHCAIETRFNAKPYG